MHDKPLNSWITKFKNKIEAFERRFKQKRINFCTIHKDDLKLYLDENNRFRLYYKDNELTKGPGLNTRIFSEANWYVSVDSIVNNIERLSSEEMIIYLNHNQLPLIQIWHLKFNSGGMLSWKVNMHIKEPLRIDCRKASLFLSKAYQDWIAFPQYGCFPFCFNSGWQCMTSFENKPDFIGAFSSLEGLPGLIFNNKDSKGLLMVQNTDFNLSSRVLEIQFEEEKEHYLPGIYPYLDVVIQIYPDKVILENIVKEIKEKERKKQEEEQRRLQELERLKQEEEKKRQEAERRRQEEERRRQEEEQRRIQELERIKQEEQKRREQNKKQDEFEQLYMLLDDDRKYSSLVEYNDIYVYGDCEKLHDKISSHPGDFNEAVSKIKTALKKGSNINIKIGVSRFNFFKLGPIVQFYSRLLNNRIDLRSVSLKFFPAKNIFYYFIEYIKELNMRLESNNIGLFLKDRDLPELLWAISSQADQYNEKDLLRLLGVIAEHAFIGPQTIVLDTNHSCNTNCIHCWIHTPKRKLSPRLINLKMDISLYKNIIDDAAGLLCDEIIIQGDGEPLLDKRFMEMVSYARDKGLKALFFTNGILLGKENASKIIDMEVNELFCSLPAGTDKTYALINPGHSKDTFHSIVDNLKDLVLMRKRTGKERPLLQMSHVIHNLNYHELEEMAKVDADIGADKSRFYLARLDKNIDFLKLKPGHIETIKDSLKKIGPYLKAKNIELQDNIYFQARNYNPATGSWSKNAFLSSGCPVGWFFSLILARGEVSICCHLRIVDKLGLKSFKEVWNSEPYDRIRAQAKYLAKNKDVSFHNNIKLYDKFCNHCDTHQVILRIYGLLQKYNLRKFYRDF